MISRLGCYRKTEEKKMTISMIGVQKTVLRVIGLGAFAAAPIVGAIACSPAPRVDHTQSALHLPNGTKDDAVNKIYMDNCKVTIGQIKDNPSIKINLDTLRAATTQIGDWFVFSITKVVCPRAIPDAEPIPTTSASISAPAASLSSTPTNNPESGKKNVAPAPKTSANPVASALPAAADTSDVPAQAPTVVIIERDPGLPPAGNYRGPGNFPRLKDLPRDGKCFPRPGDPPWKPGDTQDRCRR